LHSAYVFSDDRERYVGVIGEVEASFGPLNYQAERNYAQLFEAKVV
jgi:hypothetical protein